MGLAHDVLHDEYEDDEDDETKCLIQLMGFHTRTHTYTTPKFINCMDGMTTISYSLSGSGSS